MAKNAVHIRASIWSPNARGHQLYGPNPRLMAPGYLIYRTVFRKLEPGPKPGGQLRRVFKAVPQATTWSNIVDRDFSWLGAGFKVVMFSKSVNSDSITWACTSAN